jgi:hypothetical protein
MSGRIDIALLNNDLAFKDGDFFYEIADTQHIVDTINAFPGWWKEFPAEGVGIMQYNKSNIDTQEINRNVKVNLQADGYVVKSPAVVTIDSGGALNINLDGII